VVGPGGEWSVPGEDFCTAPGRTVLQPAELLVEFQIPVPARNASDAYLRFIPRNEMDIAVVGVGAAVTLDVGDERITTARIGLAAVGPTPIFARDASQALAGKSINDETIERAAQLAIAASSPIDDMRGTAEFRRHVTGVLTRRTLAKAIERARS